MLSVRSVVSRVATTVARTTSRAAITRLPSLLSKFTPITSTSTSTFRPTIPHVAASFHSNAMELPEMNQKVEQYFGINVFDKKTMKSHIGALEFERFEQHIRTHKPIDPAMADVIATALLKWAIDRGATHYTHWFQPITGAGAEKHDTFLDTARDGETPLSRFSSKQLILGEPDGSSFPSGGLRATHIARGYTAWDPQSAPFVLTHDNGATLYIPCLFFSWSNGQALDEKTVLLRSEYALSRETLKLFQLLGDQFKGHQYIHTDAGLEQEFFLIDREYYLKRPDLVATGRTLFGAPPAKAQQLEDQYFGHISHKALNAIHEFEVEAWKLGIPIQTRHREVAPGQYEVAPKFAPANIGTDRNLVMMDLLRKIARKHGLAALLHEKPFRGVNGSGKHNNWSLGSNLIPSLLNPGNNPQTNTLFMFFLAATVRAVDIHADLMRVAIAGAGNDHRLGANEAPPAIVSCYLGDDILAAVKRFISHDTSPSDVDLTVELGIPSVPTITRNATDRNRTSTFAFTGNKFEFRAVGASHNPSRSNQVLNTIIADSIRHMRNEIEKLKKAGKTSEEALDIVACDTLRAHQRVIFDGNGYAPEWAEEAARRGLLNLRTTPQALAYLNTPKNQKLFADMGVLSASELEARTSVLYEEYIKKVTIEGDLAAELAFTTIAPVAYETQREIASAIQAAEAVTKRTSPIQRAQLDRVESLINELLSQAELLRQQSQDAHHAKTLVDGADICEKKVIPTMAKVRAAADALERLVPAEKWPLPTYAQMMFEQD